MALSAQKIIKAVNLEKEAGQVRVVIENVVLQDDVVIYRTAGNEVYTQESKDALLQVPDGAAYATLMGW